MNMRKIVFKGVINGEEFDNVQDYNSRMQELISAGVTEIQATSSTSMKSEEPENKKKEFDLTDYLPYFNNEKYYLDQLVSDDNALNEKNLAYAEKTFGAAYSDLSKALENGEVDVNQLLNLANIIKEIRSQVAIDSSENRNAINELTEKITNDTKHLQLLNNAKPVLSTVAEYYEAAFELVKSYLLKF